MFMVIVNHWCKAGMMDRARKRLDTNGELMAGRPGFLYRHRLETPKEPNRLSTVTAWVDEASYKSWDAWKKARDAAAGPDAELSASLLFEKAENLQFHVALSHEPALQP